MKTEIVSASAKDAVTQAVELLRQGEIVALPTETVYGLAADALREDAVLKIFEAKLRPRFDPLIVHLPTADSIESVVMIDGRTNELFCRIRKQFWPGPLTFVFPRQAIISDLVTAGLKTVAVRFSSHPFFREVVAAFGKPVAAPSANRFGRISPTAAEHVREELDGLIPLIVDGGPTAHGLESTIIALRNGRIEILRRGPITEEELGEFGDVLVIGVSQHPEAPGQLPSHYSPRTPLILVDDAGRFEPEQTDQLRGLLSWRTKQDSRFVEMRRLSERQDLSEAAANLFRFLRELDACKLDLIVAEKLPDEGLGAAINDRLLRASSKLPA